MWSNSTPLENFSEHTYINITNSFSIYKLFHFREKDIRVIRPLIYAREKDLRKFAGKVRQFDCFHILFNFDVIISFHKKSENNQEQSN